MSTLTTAAYQIPKYCVKQGSTTPACPEGCVCITDAMAKQRYGDYTRCSADVCGYEQDQTAKYCIKQGSATPACPEGCSCISDATAKAKGGSWARCSADVCGHEAGTATLAAVVQVPKYCMKQEETTPVCPEGCNCLSDAMAKERYGTFTRCSADVCGYDLGAPTNALASNQIPKYCVKQGSTPVCPDGCACISDEDAKLKGLTDRCDTSQTPCGYKSAATTADQRIPLYCYKIPTPSPVCPQGCSCLQEADARLKFGPDNYTRCQADICGHDPSATTANGIPKYCFRPAVTPTAPACVYDYQKNACTGTCQAGAACSVVGKNVDEKTGATTLVCGCPQQSSCSYNYDREACVGTCMVTGENCQLNTIYRDPATGRVTFAECHCKGGGDSTSTCAYDAATGSCSGTCASGKACTMTERTTDNAGKVVCRSCGCTDTCVLNANNECSGTCVTGAPCARIVTKDASGQEKVSCGCGGTQAGTPIQVATRQPGFFDGIASFFNKLFGGK